MGVAALQSNAWSRDAAKRTRRFGRKQPGASSTFAEIVKLEEFLENTASAEWGCFDDPFVFDQLVEAARYVLEKIAPEGDPSAVPPSPPRGIDPVLAGLLMREIGRSAGECVIRTLLVDKEELAPFEFYIRACLGDDVVARLKGRIAIDPWQPDPTKGPGGSS
jgi:hypothetical protein